MSICVAVSLCMDGPTPNVVIFWIIIILLLFLLILPFSLTSFILRKRNGKQKEPKQNENAARYGGGKTIQVEIFGKENQNFMTMNGRFDNFYRFRDFSRANIWTVRCCCSDPIQKNKQNNNINKNDRSSTMAMDMFWEFHHFSSS